MTFVYNHSSSPRVCSSGQISQCKIDLGFTRKVEVHSNPRSPPVGAPNWRFSKDRGISSETFCALLEVKVFPQTGQVRRTLMLWDNIRSHTTAQVSNAVHNSIHRMLPRPPYLPKDGPVECANKQLLTQMSEECYNISSCGELMRGCRASSGRSATRGRLLTCVVTNYLLIDLPYCIALQTIPRCAFTASFPSLNSPTFNHPSRRDWLQSEFGDH